MERLTELTGLVPVEYPTTRRLGADPRDRAADLMAAFADPSIRAVLATVGGDDQVRVVGHLDPEVARADPKPFLGYSDNTNLLAWLHAAGVAAFRNGSSSLHEMGGLWRRNPIFSVMFLVLFLAVAGLPPFSGFWPKMLLVRATIAADMPWLTAAILVSGLLITIACMRAFALAFWRPLPAMAAAQDVGEAKQIAEETFRAPPPGTPLALVPLVALCIFVVVAGVWPLTDVGAALVLGTGVYTLAMAALQYAGVRRIPA